jgi:hypothetical protein
MNILIAQDKVASFLHKLQVYQHRVEADNVSMFSELAMLLDIIRSRDSSVSIVSDYKLDDRAIEVRFPAEVRGCVM